MDWFKILTRQITPQILPIVTSPKYRFPELIDAGFSNQLYVPKGRKHEFYFSGREWGTFAEAVVNRIKGDEAFIYQHAKECLDVCERIKTLTAAARDSEVRSWSNEKVRNWYVEYLDLFDHYYLFVWTPHVIEEYIEGTLKEKLKDELGRRNELGKFDDYLGIITTKVRPNLAEIEELELLNLAKDISHAGGKVTNQLDERIDTHVRKWCWLPFYSLDMDIWTKAYFVDRATKTPSPESELERRRSERDAKDKQLQEIKGELGANPGLVKLIELTQQYLFLRTDRTDALRIILHNIKPVLEELGHRMGLSYGEVIYLTPEEILDYLEHERIVSRDELARRQRHFLIITVGDGPVEIVSNEAEINETIQKQLGERYGKREKELLIQGTGIYHGQATGKVKLVETREDWDMMEEGDILVTIMTTPEMVPVYLKAKAIVTDEGGMTCHAAIVSRELRIPCVIGTGNATTVLEDGMTVEVDSEQGIVKVIES